MALATLPCRHRGSGKWRLASQAQAEQDLHQGLHPLGRARSTPAAKAWVCDRRLMSGPFPGQSLSLLSRDRHGRPGPQEEAAVAAARPVDKPDSSCSSRAHSRCSGASPRALRQRPVASALKCPGLSSPTRGDPTGAGGLVPRLPRPQGDGLPGRGPWAHRRIPQANGASPASLDTPHTPLELLSQGGLQGGRHPPPEHWP